MKYEYEKTLNMPCNVNLIKTWIILLMDFGFEGLNIEMRVAFDAHDTF